MKKRARSKESSIGDVVKSILEQLDKKGRLGEEEIREAWKAAAGKEAADHSRPTALRRKSLLVQVDDSSWLYQITLGKEKILEKLQEMLGKEAIETIQLRIGDL